MCHTDADILCVPFGLLLILLSIMVVNSSLCVSVVKSESHNKTIFLTGVLNCFTMNASLHAMSLRKHKYFLFCPCVVTIMIVIKINETEKNKQNKILFYAVTA